MRHHLQIQLRAGEGAVLRAIGLVERRGFRLESMRLAEVAGASQRLDLDVSSERPAELLKRQLERLHDVLSVELEAARRPQLAADAARP